MSKTTLTNTIIVCLIVLVGVSFCAKKPNPKEITRSKALINRNLAQKKQVKKPRAYKKTHRQSGPEKTTEVIAKRGTWLDKPVHVSGQKWLWVEFLNKNNPDDRAYVRCSNRDREITRVESRLVRLNTFEQVFSDVTLCRYFDVMLPPDSKNQSATVLFSITQMR